MTADRYEVVVYSEVVFDLAWRIKALIEAETAGINDERVRSVLTGAAMGTAAQMLDGIVTDVSAPRAAHPAIINGVTGVLSAVTIGWGRPG
jgi:hypothetical protein